MKVDHMSFDLEIANMVVTELDIEGALRSAGMFANAGPGAAQEAFGNMVYAATTCALQAIREYLRSAPQPVERCWHCSKPLDFENKCKTCIALLARDPRASKV